MTPKGRLVLGNASLNAPGKRPRSPDKVLGSFKRSKQDSPAIHPEPEADRERSKRKEKREADKEKFVQKYTEAFPNFKFHFTTSEIRDSFLPRISALGGHYEAFFSYTVTHLIVAKRVSTSSKENAPNAAKLLARANKIDEALVQKAFELNMKIWDIDKLESVVSRIYPSPVAQKRSFPITPSPITEILERERRSGVTSERDPYSRRPDYTYFPKQSFYVLVEDLRGEFAAVAAHAYPFERKFDGELIGDWPILYLHPFSHCPFVPYDAKEEKRRSHALQIELPFKKDQAITRLTKQARPSKQDRVSILRRAASCGQLSKTVDVLAPPNQDNNDLASVLQPTGHLAASGNSVAIASGTGTTSTAASGHPFSARLLSNLKKEIQNQVTLPRKTRDAGPLLRKSKSTNTLRLPKRGETEKPGYCESCRKKFKDFNTHLKQDARHRKFAENDSNFLTLDIVLARLKRRTLAGSRQID